MKKRFYYVGRLNPCFSGRWSRTSVLWIFDKNTPLDVLILVVMEDSCGADMEQSFVAVVFAS